MNPTLAELQTGLSLSVTWDGGQMYLVGQLAIEHATTGRQFFIALDRALGSAPNVTGLEEGEYLLTRYTPDVLWQATHLR